MATNNNRFRGKSATELLNLLPRHRGHVKFQIDALVYIVENLRDETFLNDLVKEDISSNEGGEGNDKDTAINVDQDGTPLPGSNALHEVAVTMRSHGNDPLVQLYGSIALACIVLQASPRSRNAAVPQALPALLATLRAHPRNGGIQAYAIMGLAGFTKDSDQAALWLTNNRALHTVHAAMLLFNKDLFLLQQALEWVRAMSECMPVFALFQQQVDDNKLSHTLSEAASEAATVVQSTSDTTGDGDLARTVAALVDQVGEIYNYRVQVERAERAQTAMSEYGTAVKSATRGRIELSYSNDVRESSSHQGTEEQYGHKGHSHDEGGCGSDNCCSKKDIKDTTIKTDPTTADASHGCSDSNCCKKDKTGGRDTEGKDNGVKRIVGKKPMIGTATGPRGVVKLSVNDLAF